MKTGITASVLTVLVGLAISGEGRAIPVPDASTCNSPQTCLYIQNNNMRAIWGDSANATGVRGYGVTGVEGVGDNYGVEGTSAIGIGVEGEAESNIGVSGKSTSWIGVWGTSNSQTGVVGETFSATAPAIHAASPSSSGLAIKGTGGIRMTGALAEKAGGGAWSAPSDSRIKKDVVDFRQGLAEVMQVRPVLYKYNGLGGTTDDGREYVGVIAQELEEISPAMVGSTMAKLNDSDADDTEIKGVDPSAFTYMLINAIQEQQKVIERQEARIAALEQGGPRLGSSPFSLGDAGAAAAFGLLPLGLLFGIRGRREQKR